MGNAIHLKQICQKISTHKRICAHLTNIFQCIAALIILIIIIVIILFSISAWIIAVIGVISIARLVFVGELRHRLYFF